MLEVGRVLRAHGLRGEVVVDLSTDQPVRVSPGAVLYAGERALTVESSRPHQGKYIVSLARVVDRAGADALRGAVLQAEPLEDSNQLWVHELIGAPVVLADGSGCGRVEAVLANPAADLLVLDTGALVPATFVVEQRADGSVVIDPPEGLLDLNTDPLGPQ